MKKIRIWFCDFWGGFPINSLEINVFYRILNKKYKVIFDSVNPEYVFFSVFGNENLKYENAIKIFYTGECVTPDFNFCDYAIGFDYINFKDRYLRYPLYLVKRLWGTKIERKTFKKSKFCCFVVSNDNKAIRERCDFFKLLSKYKKVDSGGRVLNNIGHILGPNEKDKFLQLYKFNICFENNVYEGYTTEKIIDAFRCGCIPIYYGDPLISKTFNEKAFINCHSYKSFDEIVKRVIEIDNNEKLRLAMLNEPIFVNEPLDNLEEFLLHIFEQNISCARRRPSIVVKEFNKPVPNPPPKKTYREKILGKINKFFNRTKNSN